MKTSTLSTRISTEDAEFLAKIQSSKLSIGETLMSAPARFLALSVEEVSFPTRFLNRVRSDQVNTLGDLLHLRPDDLKGKNLGNRTLEVAAEELSKFFVKKINQRPLVTLREMMQDFAADLLAREARIWEARTGLVGEPHTLEAVGQKFGLTRERVRQIENVLFSQFSKRYAAVNIINSVIYDGITLPALVFATGDLLQATDPFPLVGVLENLTPKYYLVRESGADPVISTKPQTEFAQTVKKSLNIVEEIFRGSEVPLTREAIVSALNKASIDDIARQTAITKLDNEGRWENGLLLSPNADKYNFALGILQAYGRPVHIDQLAQDVSEVCKEETSPEQLRSAFSFVPAVKSFGFGLVGFSRHVPLAEEQKRKIVSYVEGVIQRGAESYQWHTRDLFEKISKHIEGVSIGHNELNVILHASTKLAYLGRSTWILRGEHDTERKLYRDIFTNVLRKAGKPLPEDTLIERVKRQRSLHLNVHLRNEVEVLEVAPKVWGLTRRDSPFNKKELHALIKAFDDSFHKGAEFDLDYLNSVGIDSKGIRSSELLKIIEVNSEK